MRDLGNIPASLMAAAFARACSELTRTDGEFAYRILANCWQQISPLLARELLFRPTGETAACIVFIESYFKQQGNWPRMEQCLLRVLHEHVSPRVLEDFITMTVREIHQKVAKQKTAELTDGARTR